MVGLFLGGWLIYTLGIYRSLWVFGVLQSLSTAFICSLTFHATKLTLTQVVAFEDLSSGMGTAALIAFMAWLTNTRFTATQYALFSSLASFGRSFISGFSGIIVEHTNYFQFFLLCAFLAIPGLLLLFKMKKIEGMETSI